jgi:hypothetical protein
MTRWLLVVVVALAGCNKPEESDCRKAILNMQRLLGTDKMHSAQNIEGAVRSCRGASKKSSVECAIQAQTKEQLFACPFAKEMKLTDPGGGISGSGSGAVTPTPTPTPPPAPAPGSGSAGSGS